MQGTAITIVNTRQLVSILQYTVYSSTTRVLHVYSDLMHSGTENHGKENLKHRKKKPWFGQSGKLCERYTGILTHARMHAGTYSSTQGCMKIPRIFIHPWSTGTGILEYVVFLLSVLNSFFFFFFFLF